MPRRWRYGRTPNRHPEWEAYLCSRRRWLGSSTIRSRNRHQPVRFSGRLAPRGAFVQARPSPELARNLNWFDADLLPPSPLVADAMNLAVMGPAQRRDKFVAD